MERAGKDLPKKAIYLYPLTHLLLCHVNNFSIIYSSIYCRCIFFADKIFIMIRYVTLVLSLFIGIESSAQQQIKILNAFQHYKIQASTDYNKLLFLYVQRDKKVIMIKGG